MPNGKKHNIGSKTKTDHNSSHSVVNKPGKDGIILGEKEADAMFTPVQPEDLPDVRKIIANVEEILTYMCNDDVLDLKHQDENSYKEVMELKFKEFKELYPSLFNLIIEGKDISMMLEMMGRIEKVKNNEMSMDDAQEELKEKISEKYIYSQMSKEKAQSLKNEVKNLDKQK
jgi:hypothetical protein